MSRSARLSHRAEADLEELFAYYLREGGDALAARFLQALDETRARLADYPEIGNARFGWSPRLEHVRMLPIKEPFRSILIFYHLASGNPYILRILHGARLQQHLLEDESD
jgi:plasmid stabilization system protein ParE